MTESKRIRPATPEDAAAIAAIYNHYVEHTIVSFEEAPVPEPEMRARVERGLSSGAWLVAEADATVLGFAYGAPWSARRGYRTSAETTIYLAPGQTGKGLGTELYVSLLDRLRSLDLHCAVGVIALPNPASVALHEKLGFRKTGVLREIGWKLGRWVDVGYWQLLL